MDPFQQARESEGYSCVVGVDEAGRGPLAGPVVAAAVYIPSHVIIQGIGDSKKLTEKKRAELYDVLVHHEEVRYGIGIVDNERIDAINILNATYEAMNQAIAGVFQADFALIDGNRIPKECPVPAEAIVKGDSKSRLIGAASILAKHTRDELVKEYAKQWPEYRFETHKGYPTKSHLELVRTLGVLPIYRKTFGPIAALLAAQH